jgi:TolB protein
VINPDGTDLTRLTYDRASDRSPAWSPGGEWITFVSDRDGNEEIYVIRANGMSTGPTRLTDSPGQDSFPVWLPDASGAATNASQ